MMVGLERGIVKLVDYDPSWIITYQNEAKLITSKLGKMIISIHHVGSTSIPGMKAKPIIDILIVVEALSIVVSSTDWKNRLLNLKYSFHIHEQDARLFYTKGPEKNRIHHLSIVQKNSSEHINQISFRDYLRQNILLAKEYEKLKIELSEKFTEKRAE